MTTVKTRAPQRKPARALLQRKPPKKTKQAAYFDIDTFASENDRLQCKRVNDYGRRLGRLENPAPGQLEHYWTHQGEMIATIGSKFWPIKDAASEAQARRIARQLKKTIDGMIVEWRRTERAAIAAEIRRRELLEAERKAEIAHDRALAIAMWPQLADEDFFTMHGWVFSGCDLGEPRRPGARSTFNSFFKRR